MNKVINSKRIMIIGSPASGKSTLAYELSKILGIPVYHLDKYYWKDNWEATSFEDFREVINNIVLNDTWIIDGDYFKTIDIRLKRADLIIYLNIDSEISVKSYLERVRTGGIRDFNTNGLKEEVDEEFIKYIRDYKEYRGPMIKSLLDPYKDFIYEIKSREEVNELVNMLKNELIR